MTKTIKNKWIQALRSGKYKQGTGQLRNLHGEFCCLGVLCDIVDKDIKSKGKKTSWKRDTRGAKFRFLGSAGYLPASLIRKTKLSLKTQANLVRMNDRSTMPFEEIALWIEENV